MTSSQQLMISKETSGSMLHDAAGIALSFIPLAPELAAIAKLLLLPSGGGAAGAPL
jgi:hypothetical protein